MRVRASAILAPASLAITAASKDGLSALSAKPFSGSLCRSTLVWVESYGQPEPECGGQTLQYAAHGFPPLLAQGAAMAIEDAVALAESLCQSRDIDQALRSYESIRRPRAETIRAAVRRVTIMRGLEGPVTPELLKQHPRVFSASLKAFDELIEDPSTAAQDAI